MPEKMQFLDGSHRENEVDGRDSKRVCYCHVWNTPYYMYLLEAERFFFEIRVGYVFTGLFRKRFSWNGVISWYEVNKVESHKIKDQTAGDIQLNKTTRRNVNHFSTLEPSSQSISPQAFSHHFFRVVRRKRTHIDIEEDSFKLVRGVYA